MHFCYSISSREFFDACLANIICAVLIFLFFNRGPRPPALPPPQSAYGYLCLSYLQGIFSPGLIITSVPIWTENKEEKKQFTYGTLVLLLGHLQYLDLPRSIQVKLIGIYICCHIKNNISKRRLNQLHHSVYYFCLGQTKMKNQKVRNQ